MTRVSRRSLLVRFTAVLAMGLTPLGARGQEFKEYPAEALLPGRPAAPRLASPGARRFRTQLVQQSAEGPNFNGHYRVASWGCGSNCLQWAVIDLRNGAVWMAPTETCVEARLDANGQPQRIETRIDSRLLYLYECQMTAETACPHGTDLRRRASTWSGTGMRLVGTACVPSDSPP